MRLRFISHLVIACITFNLASQSNIDSLQLVQSKAKVVSLYENKMEELQHFYNGPEYVEYEPLEHEHPFFETEDWVDSDLKYDDEWFFNIPLLLDLRRGKLIAFNYHNGTTMQLVDELVDEFTMNGHRFVNIKYLIGLSNQKNEFYELLYDGKSKALAHHTKLFARKLEVNNESRSFTLETRYLIFHDGQFVNINTRRDLLNTFEKYRKEIKDFIRINQLMRRNNREESLVQVVQYFDSLNP